MTLMWYKDNAPITTSPSFTITKISDKASILSLTSVGYQHIGMYSCEVANQAGKTTENAELKVQGMKIYYIFCPEIWGRHCNIPLVTQASPRLCDTTCFVGFHYGYIAVHDKD